MKTQVEQRLSDEARAALVHMSKPWACAREFKFDPWDFSLRLLQLEKLGVSESDLRWLVSSGYVDQADEVTTFRDPARRFQSRTNVDFTGATCFVLSEKGALVAGQAADRPRSNSSNSPETVEFCSLLPRWDGDQRMLYLGRQIIKEFKQPSPNQEIILMVFEEEGWPRRIDDPLSPARDIDPKRRLHDTIKCLNRHQENRLLHFSGDGSGERIRWEIFVAETLPIPSDTPLRVRAAA